MTNYAENLRRCEECGTVKNPVEVQLRTDSDNEERETFHICSNIDCDEYESDIREKERWKLRTDPDSEYSDEALDEIVEEILEIDRMTERVTIELTELTNSTSDSNTTERSTGESTDSAQSAGEPTANDQSSENEQ
jgi:hypothetical protein